MHDRNLLCLSAYRNRCVAIYYILNNKPGQHKTEYSGNMYSRTIYLFFVLHQSFNSPFPILPEEGHMHAPVRTRN